jgi:membrane protein implicated in regulation of membrane protease activity
MPGWVIWAIVAVALAVGEIVTPGLFFLGPIALAAVASLLVAALGGGAAVQLIVFIIGSLASLAILRPIARRHVRMPPMRAERDKRAAILQAEGTKQAAILTAEGDKQAAILTAEGDREAQILTAEGEAKAIETVFQAIHANDPDPQLLAYQYLQKLPEIADGEASKVWMIPSDLGQTLMGFWQAVTGGRSPAGVDADGRG